MIQSNFEIFVYFWIAFAIVLFPLLIKIRAPYGRHTSLSWGPVLSNRAGWIIMELPSLVLFMVLFLSGDPYGAKWVFFAFWVIHYTNRIFVFPLRTKTRGKKMPLLIVALASVFNLINGFVNGYWLGHMSHLRQGFGGQVEGGELRAESMGMYGVEWFTDPRFIIGVSVFVVGLVINQSADNYLIRLRKGDRRGYFIPRGGLFKYVSCPNFLGEIIEWTGFAIMTWALPGLSFAVWTAVNLIPRALHHHSWYKENFNDYPTERKAVIPGLL